MRLVKLGVDKKGGGGRRDVEVPEGWVRSSLIEVQFGKGYLEGWKVEGGGAGVGPKLGQGFGISGMGAVYPRAFVPVPVQVNEGWNHLVMNLSVPACGSERSAGQGIGWPKVTFLWPPGLPSFMANQETFAFSSVLVPWCPDSVRSELSPARKEEATSSYQQGARTPRR